MNIFIQWQETISDAYLTDTPSYFPLIEPNISLLPQGSLAGIPSNALIQLCIKCFAFLTQIRRKYVIFVIPTKNKVICNFESIYVGRLLLTKLVVLLTF